jgi:hypothetical protein
MPAGRINNPAFGVRAITKTPLMEALAGAAAARPVRIEWVAVKPSHLPHGHPSGSPAWQKYWQKYN